MSKKNKETKERQNNLCNCDSCKEMRTLDRIDRVSRWVLGTVKWTYDFGYIMGSGALSDKNHPLEKFKNLGNDEKNISLTIVKKHTNLLKNIYCFIYAIYLEHISSNVKDIRLNLNLKKIF